MITGLCLLPVSARAEHDGFNVQVGMGCHGTPAVAPPGYSTYPAPAPSYWTSAPPQQWVPGHYEQRWVPEQCFRRPHGWGWGWGGRMACRPGYYQQIWVNGYYAPVGSGGWTF